MDRSASGCDYESEIDVWKSVDLYFVMLFTALAYLFVLVSPFNQTVLRIPFALLLLLFLPGYVLISAMFPRRNEISGIERFVLSVGMSIAITVFDGFAISVTPLRLRPYSIVISLSMITLFLTLITLIIRVLTPREERYGVTIPMILAFFAPLRERVEMSDIEKALLIALIGSIIIASSMFAYAKVIYEMYGKERFTAFYILGKEGKAENYPKSIHLLEPAPIIVGVENYEHAPTEYMLRIVLGKYILYEQKIALDHNDKWKKTVYVVPKHVGRNMKLMFLLFKGDDLSSPYRRVHLRVDSEIDYENLDRIKHYALRSPPDVDNGDMEANSNWTFETNANFRGHFTKFHMYVENVTVRGYVTDNETGMPIPNAKVHVSNHYGYEKWNLTDERGYYELRLIRDHFWISCEVRGYDRMDEEFDARGADEGDVMLNFSLLPVRIFNMTLKELAVLNESTENENESAPTFDRKGVPICNLRGHVVDNETGEGIANASVILESELGFRKQLMTDEGGYFEVNVVAGKTRISASAYGYMGNSTTEDLQPSSEAHVVVRLDRKPEADAIVCGRIYDNSTGMPLPNAYVQVRNEEFGYHNYTISNASGYYEMRVVAGTVQLDVRKERYFTSSTVLNISHNETVSIPFSLERIPPPATITGYVRCKGVSIPHVSVVVSEIKNGSIVSGGYEKRTVTDDHGYFEMDVMPGHLCLEVIPNVYGERIEFYVNGGERLRLDVQLKAFPNSTYHIICPAEASLARGYHGGISQKLFAEREGVATLSFSVSDSFRAEGPSGYLFKQVLINDIVVWEDDVAGDEGWQHVKIPVTFDAGENTVSLRLYAKKDAKRFQMVSCWFDDVRIEPLFEYTKEKATIFHILNAEGTAEYLKELHLGEPVDFIAEIENHEKERMHYTIQARLNGYLLHQREITLDDGEKWRHKLTITPNQLGSLLKLEFLLFATPVRSYESRSYAQSASDASYKYAYNKGEDGKPYKSFSLWLPCTINYSNLDVLEKFVLPRMPEIENGDMEACCENSVECGWIYEESDANFTGAFTNATSVSPFCSYEIAFPAFSEDVNAASPAGCYAEISQRFSIPSDASQLLPANIVISFSVRDSYKEERKGVFRKQVILNDDVIWEDDVAGDEGWQHVKVPLTLYSADNNLTLRVSCDAAVQGFPISVWWDDVRIEPITAVAYKMGTSFRILDANGTTIYPTYLHMGKPTEIIAEIENNEGTAVNYILRIELGGHPISTHLIGVGKDEKVRHRVSFVPDIVCHNESLEFLLFKERITERPYRYFRIDNVSCVIDPDYLDALLRYGVKRAPEIRNGDMSSASGWEFERNGSSFAGSLTHDAFVSPPSSYCIKHIGESQSGEFGAITQRIHSSSSGIAILSFNLRDDYRAEEHAMLIKEVVLDDIVILSDDVSGDDSGYMGYVVERYNETEDRWIVEHIPDVKDGWLHVDIPVYLREGDNELVLRVRTVGRFEGEVNVFWDDLSMKPVDDIIMEHENMRSRRYGW